jgi:transcription initiation factor TFIIIB Brf1 subunit/transcription initiation factor TFIIB
MRKRPFFEINNDTMNEKTNPNNPKDQNPNNPKDQNLKNPKDQKPKDQKPKDQNPNNPKDQNPNDETLKKKCRYCKNISHNIFDPQYGHTCCDVCGIVNEYMLDDTVEWKIKTDGFIHNQEQTHCNAVDELLPKLSLSTRITPCYGSKSYNQDFRIAKLNQWYSGDPIERAIHTDFDYIDGFSHAFSEPVLYMAKVLFKEFYIANSDRSKEFLLKRDCLRGDSRKGLIGICLYFALKIHSIHYSKNNIATILDINVLKIRKARPVFLTVLQDKIVNIESWNQSIAKICNVKDFIITYQKVLRVPSHVQKYAMMFYKYLKPTRLLGSKQPQSIAALSMWVVLGHLNSKIYLNDIVAKCEISMATLKNSYKSIEPHIRESMLYVLVHYVCEKLNISNGVTILKIFHLSYTFDTVLLLHFSELFKIQEIIALAIYTFCTLKKIYLTNIDELFKICGNVQEKKLIKIWKYMAPYKQDIIASILE